MRSLDNSRDQQGQNISLRPMSDCVYQVDLIANIAERIAIPSGAKRVIFSGTHNYWILCGDSSVVATNTGDISDGSASELNPSGYTLNQAISGAIVQTHISVIADQDSIITMAFYA